MSDLVRKADGAAKTSGKDTALSFSRMGSLLGEPGPPGGAEARPASEPLYEMARQEVGRIVESAAQGKPFEVRALQAMTTTLVEALATSDALLVQALEGSETPLNLPSHMVNVAIFAIKIGQGIGYGEGDLRRLALAACLHDVGMVTMPRDILKRPEALTSDEAARVHHHPVEGFRILQTLGPEFEWLAIVALQEQEREDGSGYPEGLKGDQIHENAKIVGLADMYDALIHPRPYQKRGGPADAIKEIVTGCRRLFPGRILKGLIQGLSTFPVGSLVRLNSKEIARVVATNAALPLRPVVEILFGAQGERLPEPRRLDLAQNTLLYIMDSASKDAASPSGSA